MDPVLKNKTKQIVEGQTPKDNLQDMHNCLVRYIAAFEPNFGVKRNMQELYLYFPYGNVYTHGSYPLGNRGKSESFNNECHPQTVALALFDLQHPIGSSIHDSKRALRDGGLDNFLEIREEIVGSLEEQYQRIVRASATATEYLKAMKINWEDPEKHLIHIVLP